MVEHTGRGDNGAPLYQLTQAVGKGALLPTAAATTAAGRLAVALWIGAVVLATMTIVVREVNTWGALGALAVVFTIVPAVLGARHHRKEVT